MSATEPLVKISNLEIDGIADETRIRIINNVNPSIELTTITQLTRQRINPRLKS